MALAWAGTLFLYSALGPSSCSSTYRYPPVPVLDAQQELLDGDRRPPVLLLLEQREADGAGEVDFLVEQWGHELHLAVLLLVEQREADGARGKRGSRRSGGTAWHELPLSVLLGRWTETNFTDSSSVGALSSLV
jgi:hypothetical protein